MSVGRLIVVEGIDGSGKTAVTKRLSELWDTEFPGQVVHCVRDPGSNPVAESVRDIIMNNGDIASTTEMMLFAAARSQLVEQTIVPVMQEGKTVICDRFTPSTFVYQISRLYGQEEMLDNFNVGLQAYNMMSSLTMLLRWPTPWVYIYLKCPTELCSRRIAEKKNGNRLDADEKEQSIRARLYDWYFRMHPNVIVADTSCVTLDETVSGLFSSLKELAKRKPM